MTDRQSRYIYVLCTILGIPIPEFVVWGLMDTTTQKVTKAEAATLITKLKSGERPTAEYIDSLGRGNVPVSTMCSAE